MSLYPRQRTANIVIREGAVRTPLRNFVTAKWLWSLSSQLATARYQVPLPRFYGRNRLNQDQPIFDVTYAH